MYLDVVVHFQLQGTDWHIIADKMVVYRFDKLRLILDTCEYCFWFGLFRFSSVVVCSVLRLLILGDCYVRFPDCCYCFTVCRT